MAFASPVTLFTGTTSPALVHRGRRLVSRPRPRSARSHIVALGAAPPPPPPESDSEADASKVPTPEPVPEAPEAPSTGSPASNGTAESTDDVLGAADILSSPSFLKKKLEIIEKELIEAREAATKAEDQLKEEKASYMRLAADFDNFRRRNATDMSKLETKSVAKVCKGLMEVLDNFDRALVSVQTETEKEESIQKSYSGINKQLVDALVKLGVEAVDPLGKKFDPLLHEAIQKEESTEYPEDVVSAVFQKGYTIGENLVRAAIVAVSTGPGPEKVDVEEAAKEEVVAEKSDEPVTEAAEAEDEKKKEEGK